ILHRPDKGYTVQLGNGQLLADLTGVEVVYDFRSRDVLAGGQGAPLAPAYHRALARAARLITPLVIVNIGGISNVTWVGRGGEILAFDAGPGNALLDDWVRRYADQPMDRDGRMARRGTVDESAVAAFLGQDYFSRKPPKSLDRHDFSAFLVEGLGPADGAATLTAITTEAIARAVDHMPKKPVQWVISGGGALNPVMMKMLKSRLKGRVDSAQALGWSVDYMEAEAFAFLAVRSCYNLPITFPGTTGVLEPMTGGVRVRPAT
ncbi:MAG: anhydro-N-acetylmuramic acid kinase, partial [Alphaproteobacteria bacterium]